MPAQTFTAGHLSGLEVPSWHGTYSVAVLIPCFNEAGTVAKVVRDFKASLPSAAIYVYDNNSTDRTAVEAATAGAIVRREARQGKGNVVRRMFADVEADVFVLVDGDGTYDAAVAGQLIELLVEQHLDFVNGARVHVDAQAFRRGHVFGNFILTGLVRSVFGREFLDMLSGYKVFSRRFAKSFPAMSKGFEIETELVVHALELRMPSAEVSTKYFVRPTGSMSKLRTFRDGGRILRLIAHLIRNERPLEFFGLLGVGLFIVACLLSIPLWITYFDTGLVPRLPTAVLSVGLVIAGTMSIFAGLIMEMITKARQELKRMMYLLIKR